MSEFRVNSITNQDGSAGPQVCGVSTFSGKSGVQIPSGPTEFRRQDGGGRGRGVFGSGASPGNYNVMDLITIATTGNSTDFGDDFKVRQENYASFSSSVRGINAGGYNPAAFTSIAFFTFASQGGMNDFGELQTATYANAGCGNNIRGLSGGGNSGSTHNNIIEFVNIASTGDGNDFGDLIEGNRSLGSGIASPTRGIWHGGNTSDPSGNEVKTIQFITIPTLGDAVNFGELITARNSHSGCSNSTRGLIVSGQNPSNLNSIEFITIATEGNGTDFGDISTNGRDYQGSCASATRGVNAGGQTPSKLNVIEFVTIATTGNATDFGDLTQKRRFLQGCSDVHGGLAQ